MNQVFYDETQLLQQFAGRVDVVCPKCAGAAVVTQTSLGENVPRCVCDACGFSLRGLNVWLRPWKARYRGHCESCSQRIEDELRDKGGEIPTKKVFHCDICKLSVPGFLLSWSGERGIHDPHLGASLRLQTRVGDEVLWVYNQAHLEFLESYVSASIRKRASHRNASLASRLPQWMKKAQNRKVVLKGLAEIRKML